MTRTGPAWIEHLPHEWQRVRLKTLFRIVNGSTPRSSDGAFWDGDVIWITPEDLGRLRERDISASERTLTVEGYRSCGTTLVPPGSLVVSTRAPIGYVARACVQLCTNQGCKSLVPLSEADTRYFYYVLLAARGELESRGQGYTFLELSSGQLAGIPIPYPEAGVQRRIADFLDEKCAAIDELIRKKGRMLELLAEHRSALIHQAVTKGLDPGLPMRDSKVAWIGRYPAHWTLERLKFACTLQRGFDLPTEQRAEGPVPIIAGGGVSGFHDTAMVDAPGVVTGRYGTIGEVHLVRTAFWPLNTALYVREFYGNSEPFVRYMLSSLPLKMFSGKSAVPGVDRKDPHELMVVVPPRPEQDQIVASLDEQLARVHEAGEAIRTQTARLGEYRQALITAAVTGQLDLSSEVPAISRLS